MRPTRTATHLAAALGTALLLSACATPGPYASSPPREQGDVNRTARGAAIGAVAGAVVGAISGDDARQRRNRALIGAGVGALAGGAIGSYMDRKEAAMREQLAGSDVTIVRRGDDLILSMPESITFAFNSADLNPRFHGVLDRVADVSRQYPQTLLEIAGHTDSIGSDAYNQQLSERRAQAVGNYLANRGLSRDRLITIGGGKRYPVASNETEAGRAANRRVELTIMPVRG